MASVIPTMLPSAVRSLDLRRRTTLLPVVRSSTTNSASSTLVVWAAVVGVEDFLDGAYFLFDETILVVHGPPPLVLYGVLVVRRCQARHRSQRAWQSPRCVKGLGKRGVRLRTTKLAANKKELSSGPRNA